MEVGADLFYEGTGGQNWEQLEGPTGSQKERPVSEFSSDGMGFLME